MVLFISHYSNKLRCVRFKIDLAVKISRQELTLASCAQPGHLQKLQEGEVLGRVAFVSLHSVDLALCCCYQCWDYMDECNYPLDSICPCLKETQLCLCTAEISGTEFSLSKEKFRTTVWKSLCKPEVFFPKMPPVSCVFQWRNWTYPRSSFPLFILCQQCQGSLKSSTLFPAHFPSPHASVGSSLSSLPQFHMEISSSSREIPAQALRGSWKAAELCLSSPCPARSVDSLWELFPSNNSRVYLPLSSSLGSRMCSQI